MSSPLRVGVAGLGNVGAALVAQIVRQRTMLAEKCGRGIEVVAVCARNIRRFLDSGPEQLHNVVPLATRR